MQQFIWKARVQMFQRNKIFQEPCKETWLVPKKEKNKNYLDPIQTVISNFKMILVIKIVSLRMRKERGKTRNHLFN